MAFELLPYTNFHDLNLDWIMSQFPKVYEARDEATAAAEGVEAFADAAEAARDAAQAAQGLAEAAQLAAEAAQGYAEDAASSAAQYAEDAEDIVEHALNDIGTGTAGAVADWLSENVDPATGYVIDKSLTIAGAAADARATGLSVGGLREFWKPLYTTLEWEQGDINLGTGAEVASNTAVRSGFVPIPSSIPVLVTGINEDDDLPIPPPEISVGMAVYTSDDVSDFVSSSGPVTENAGFFGEAGYYVRFVVKYTGGGNIDPTATILNGINVDICEPTDTDLDLALGTTGHAADSGAVGDAIRALYNEISQVSGLSEEAKSALLNCFSHVAWIDEHGQDYYDALEEALYDTTWPVTNNLTHCTTSNTAQSVAKNYFYTADITASAGYTLEGASVSITMGGVDITSTAYSNGNIYVMEVTGPLVITISAVAVGVSSISAVYTQSGTVYDTDSLDSLKTDLVVTATYSDSSTDTVPAADYTLSGTLTVGTSTITVSYGGHTTTFTVTVSASPTPGYLTGYTSVGTPNISNGILTVSDGNFIKTPEVFSPGNSTWKVCCKHKVTGVIAGNYGDIYGSVDTSNASVRALLFELNNAVGDAAAAFLSSNGTAWDITSSDAASMGTSARTEWVWTEIAYDGTDYTWKYSFNGVTYTTAKTVSSSSKLMGGYAVGYGLKRNGILTGQIDLNECKIYINDALWWTAIA